MQIDSSTEVGYLHAIAFILEAASMANEPSAKPTLISHKLCPYVQRVAIALAEKSLPFIRVDIDLAAKPDWFLAISPLGTTPVLNIENAAIFESAVILEYLEDMCSPPL